jgi:pimeloyl-ACP methyl ester carboxylesterase
MPEMLQVGAGPEARQIAVLRRGGAQPGLFWLGGFRSQMTGSKAEAVATWGSRKGLSVTRFDYSGHGQSGGDFLDGTISRWLDEALAVFATTTGPQVVIGSSMGGWLALLLNRALRVAGSDRVRAIILVAPAVDMTAALMEARFTRAEQRALAETGLVLRPSRYGDGPYPYTRALIEDGRNHLLLDGPRGIVTGCPVTILQGVRDPDVPPAHALRVADHILADPLTVTLVPDGDHRLSRPQDLDLLTNAIARAVEDAVPRQGQLPL